MWVAGAQAFGPSSDAFPGRNRELDTKWNSWHTNWHLCGMQGLQVASNLLYLSLAPTCFR